MNRRSRWALLSRHWLFAALLVAVVVQWVVVLLLTREAWFGHDAWAYITRRVAIPDANDGLWEPFGGHWQTTVILLYRTWFHTFGLASYAPYLAVSLTLHTVVTLATYALLRRSQAAASVSGAVAFLVLFYGPGSEVFVGDGPMPLVAGIAFGLVALVLLSVDRVGVWRLVVAALLLVLGVTTSGSGLVGLVFVGLVTASRHGWPRGVLVTVPAAAAFAAWYIAVGRDSGRVSTHGWTWAEAPAYVWRGLTDALSLGTGVAGAGAAVLTLLVLCAVAAPAPAPLRGLALGGLAAAVVQMALSGLASLDITEGQDTAGRYTYLAMVLLAPSVALAVTTAVEWTRRNQPVRSPLVLALVAALLAGYAIQSVALQHRQAELDAGVARAYRGWIAGSEAALLEHEAVLTPLWDNAFFNTVDIRLLTHPAITAKLPDVQVSPEQRLLAENDFFVYVGATEQPDLFRPAVIAATGFLQPNQPGSGCHAYDAGTLSAPEVVLATGEGNQFGVTSPSTEITTVLERDGVTSRAHTWRVEPGPVYVATTAHDAVLRVWFNGTGSYLICHQ